MHYTPEQSAPIASDAHTIVVKSAAGSGKTTVLVGFAQANPNVRMLYLCYNKAIQLEAEKRFPKNVVCRTAHAIAFHYYGKPLQHKLGNLRITDVKRHLSSHDWDLPIDSVTVFNKYLASGDEEVSVKHVVVADLRASHKTNAKYQAKLVHCARDIWNASIDPQNPLPAVHDVYLKLYALNTPDLSRYFGCLLFDEAQDANPVISTIISNQSCRKFIVGDDHQQLYRWRGAENALSEFARSPDAKTFYMTQSFRFGPRIAQLATTLLKYKRSIVECDIFDVKGLDSISDSIVSEFPEHVKGQCPVFLHRTVSATIQTAILHADANIYWIGGIENYNIQELLDVYHLSALEKDRIKRRKLLTEFQHYGDYKQMAKDSGDSEMNRIIAIIDQYGHRVPAIIARLRETEAKDAEYASIIISTAHRSKGLEFPYVQLSDDFPDLVGVDSGKLTDQEKADEVNLLYVASTRATQTLVVSAPVMMLLMAFAPELAKRIQQASA